MKSISRTLLFGLLSLLTYAPFIFNVAIPVGAIVFLAKRRSWVAQRAG